MNSPRAIKTILYDLDGTLRLNQPSGREFFIDHLVTLGFSLSGEDRRRVGVWEHRYWAESAEMLRDMAELTTPESFWTNYARLQMEALGFPLGHALELAPELSQFMSEHYQPQDLLAPGAQDVLRRLQTAGYLLGVVSNRDRPFRDYLVEKGLDTYVTFSLSGGEAGSKKPDKGIFDQALRLAGSCAHEAIYVGDNYFADVVGARAAGVQPVLFDPAGIFLEPDCPTIRAHDELPALLDGRDSWLGNGR